ncbi:MAG TPA: hypothetical protein GX513_13335 [Firmicutes bacterium]|nr:hypothetical protein [Bacillota bacterium]
MRLLLGRNRVSLGKGNQAGGGNRLAVLGNVEKTGSQDDSHEYKSFRHGCEVTTDEMAEAPGS